MMRAFEIETAEPQCLGHARLLLEALCFGESGLEVHMLRQVVRQAVQHAVAGELNAVVAAP